MKVVAFCGSARKQGNTYLLQQAVLDPLADAGAETEIIELAGSENAKSEQRWWLFAGLVQLIRWTP